MALHDWTRVPPNVFHHFHTAWLAQVSDALNRGVLPEDHFAALEQYSGDATPDIITLRSSDDSGFEAGDKNGVLAVAEAPPKVAVTQEAEHFLTRQKQIVIRHNLGEVVALIELVSPENKRSAKSLNRFCDKVLSAIDQSLHVLVLDVLRPGKHDTRGVHGAIWDELSDERYQPPAEKPLTLASYEAGDLTRAYVEPLAVGDELPAMPIFLDQGKYVEVPLAETYDRAWEGTPRPWREMLVTSDAT